MEVYNPSGPSFEKPSPVIEKAPPQRKGFPVFGIAAIVMLALMLSVFALEIFLSFLKMNIMDLARSQHVGLQNYERLFRMAEFVRSVEGTLVFRLIQLGISGTLAAGFCALYYAMKNPKTALTFACLWLIPACLPYLTMSMYVRSSVYRADTSGTLLYLLTTVLQTTSIFCFFGGLFTFLNLKKKGKAGGGPYYGLLVAVLTWMLSAMTANAVYSGMMSGMITGRTLDVMNYRVLIQNMQFGLSSALGVTKVLCQIALALVPMIVLCILARRKSTKGKTPLTVLWVFLAIPTGMVLSVLLRALSVGSDIARSVFNSLVIVLIGGSFGGLIAYSFIHLLRRVPAFLYGLIAVILAASLSCMSSQYYLMRQAGLINTIWPQVFLAAFDGRLVLIITVLAFALRDYTETRPGSLAIAVALLAGAFLWGEFNTAMMYISNSRMYPISILALQYSTNAVQLQSSASGASLLASHQTVSQLLLAIPPLLLGTGAALLLKHSLSAPENPGRG